METIIGSNDTIYKKKYRENIDNIMNTIFNETLECAVQCKYKKENDLCGKRPAATSSGYCNLPCSHYEKRKESK
jgi:hypothetical protein